MSSLVLLSLVVTILSCISNLVVVDGELGTDPNSIQMDYTLLCEKWSAYDAASSSSSSKLTYDPTCRRFSKIIMGTAQLAQKGKETLTTLLTEALKYKINTIDTAFVYNNTVAEKYIGEWIQELNSNGKVIDKVNDFCPGCPLNIMTKGGYPEDIDVGTYRSRLHGSIGEIESNVYNDLTGSLSRLHHDIALYYLHRDDFNTSNFTVDESNQTNVSTILSSLSSNKVRPLYNMLGVSNWDKKRIDVAEDYWSLHSSHYGENNDIVRVVASQPYFSLMEMNKKRSMHIGGRQVFHSDMLNPSYLPGIAIMTYSPLAGCSLFSLGWDKMKQKAQEMRDNNDRYWRHVYESIFTNKNKQRYDRLISFTKEYNQQHNTNYTIDQMASAYVLAHPRVDNMIIGARSVDQLHRTMKSIEIATTLTRDNLEYLYSGNTNNKDDDKNDDNKDGDVLKLDEHMKNAMSLTDMKIVSMVNNDNDGSSSSVGHSQHYFDNHQLILTGSFIIIGIISILWIVKICRDKVARYDNDNNTTNGKETDSLLKKDKTKPTNDIAGELDDNKTTTNTNYYQAIRT